MSKVRLTEESLAAVQKGKEGTAAIPVTEKT
jgi:hypothetical protein